VGRRRTADTPEPPVEIFDYDNILLLPRKCRVDSRSQCDPSVEFGGRRFALPVVPSNMRTVIDEPIAQVLARSGHFYVMHRFDLDNVAFARRMREHGLFVSISSGVKPQDFLVVDRLAAEGVGADYITIDIAHGHADSVRRTIEHIKARLPGAFVIAGNVATPEAVIDLENWGADATKVGVGPGKVCITKLKTGFGTGGWQLSALKWCARVATKPIIADGGIQPGRHFARDARRPAEQHQLCRRPRAGRPEEGQLRHPRRRERRRAPAPVGTRCREPAAASS